MGLVCWAGDATGMKNPGVERDLGLPVPESAALGLCSGGCSSKLRQVSTSSPRGGGRARHREARTASAAWHRGPPAPQTPLMPRTLRPAEQWLEPQPSRTGAGQEGPKKTLPAAGPRGSALLLITSPQGPRPSRGIPRQLASLAPHGRPLHTQGLA